MTDILEMLIDYLKEENFVLYIFSFVLLFASKWIYDNKYREIMTKTGKFTVIIASLVTIIIFYLGICTEISEKCLLWLILSSSTFFVVLFGYVFKEPTFVYKELLALIDSKDNFIEKYRKVLELENQESEFHLKEWEYLIQYKIYLLYNLGDNKLALQNLEKIDDKTPYKKNLEALIKEREFKYEDSYNLLEAARNIHDDNYSKYAASILCNIGRVYRCRGYISEALSFYREAINKISEDDLEKLDIVYTNYIITLCYDNNNTTAEKVNDWILKYKEKFPDNCVGNRYNVLSTAYASC